MAAGDQPKGRNDYLDREKYRLDGYVILITGGSAGVGKEAARDLALRGAKIVMGNRNLEKSANVIAALRAEECEETLPEDRIVAKKLNLADLSSVRSFAEEIKKEYPVIDVLINNAGKMGGHRETTGDGFESQFQTNHLGHFLLTHLLIDCVLASKNKPKVLNLSSKAHENGIIDLDDMQSEKSYARRGFQTYCNTKLMNILFTKSLAQKYGDKLNTYAVHPGFVKTELGRYSTIASTIYFVASMFAKTEKSGALTTVYCCVSKKAAQESGLYYADSKVCQPIKRAEDMEMAQKLWDESCKLLNITWDP